MEHPYLDFLDLVEKPVRYLGGEPGAHRRDWENAAFCCRFVLCFPDVYDIGMSHLGSRILYKAINQCDDLLMERAFCPWLDMEAQLRQRQLPLVSLESAHRLADFDVVGFSLQYEMTYTNVLTMLELGGIPLRTADRGDQDPLVLGGGPCATHPEAVADFFDAFLIGDGEEALPALLRLVGELRREGLPRREILIRLAMRPGVYAPSLYKREVDAQSGFEVVTQPLDERVPERVTRQYVADLNDHPFPVDGPLALTESVFDRMSVELARGCTEGCRFCQAGIIYRPVRERDPQNVLETVKAAVSQAGYDAASLTSLSPADYSCITPLIIHLMDHLRDQKVSLGISSLRAYGLPERLLDEIASVKATGLTFAPEAGSQRMRDVINKNISEEDVLETCRQVFRRGWQRVKFYFILGLPGETDEDVVAISTLARRALGVGRDVARAPVVTVSVSSHVPKPHTPFQWCGMLDAATIEQRQDTLRGLLDERGLRFRCHDHRLSRLEAIVGRADRRAGSLIEAAWRMGARFDAWDDQLRHDIWDEALQKWQADENLHVELMLDSLSLEARLPWDHIDTGVSRNFLIAEYERARQAATTAPCGKPAGMLQHPASPEEWAEAGRLVCHHCGLACNMSQMSRQRKQWQEAVSHNLPAARDLARPATVQQLRGRPAHDFHQGIPVKLRLRHNKLDRARLLSQLDLARLLPQLMRRSALPVYYSEGFSPHPVMSFGPALNQGAASLAEYLEISLVGPQEALPSASNIVSRLNESIPLGIEFTDGRFFVEREKGLSKELFAADWLVQIKSELAFDQLAQRLAHLLNTKHIPVRVLRKNRERELNLAELLLHAELLRAEAGQWPGVPAGQCVLVYRIRTGGASVKPQEVLHALLDVELAGAGDVLRTALWLGTAAEDLRDPLEIPDDPALA